MTTSTKPSRRFLYVNLAAAALGLCGLILFLAGQMLNDGDQAGVPKPDAKAVEFVDRFRDAWSEVNSGESARAITVTYQDFFGEGTFTAPLEAQGASWLTKDLDGNVVAFFDAEATDPALAGKVLARAEDGWTAVEVDDTGWFAQLGLGHPRELLVTLEAEEAVGQLAVSSQDGLLVATLEDGRSVRLGEREVAYSAVENSFTATWEDLGGDLELPQVKADDLVEPEVWVPGERAVFEPGGDRYQSMYALAKVLGTEVFGTPWGELLGEMQVSTAEELAEALRAGLAEQGAEDVVVKVGEPVGPGEVSVALHPSLFEAEFARYPQVPVVAFRAAGDPPHTCFYVTVGEDRDFRYGAAVESRVCSAADVHLRDIQGYTPFQATFVHELEDDGSGDAALEEGR